MNKNKKKEYLLRLISKLADDNDNRDWDESKLELLLEQPPAEFDRTFGNLLKSIEIQQNSPESTQGGTEMLSGAMSLPKTFDLAKFVGVGWRIWRGCTEGNGFEGEEAQDTRSLAFTEVDFRCVTKKVNFVLDLAVRSSQGIRQLQKTKVIQADARIGQALCEEKDQKTLRYLFYTLGVTSFELFGTILRSPSGDLCVLRFVYSSHNSTWSYVCRDIADNCHDIVPRMIFTSAAKS